MRHLVCKLKARCTLCACRSNNSSGLLWICLPGLALFALTLLLAACSTPDEEEQAKIKRFIESHPHPFELRATESSIIGRYLWIDILENEFLKNIMLASKRKYMHFPFVVKQRRGQHEVYTKSIATGFLCQGL